MRIIITAIMALALAGCGSKTAVSDSEGALDTQQSFKWKLVTTWPKNYPGLGSAPENFANRVAAMSGGRLTIKVFGAGQLVPAFEQSLRGRLRWVMARLTIGREKLRPPHFSPRYLLV